MSSSSLKTVAALLFTFSRQLKERLHLLDSGRESMLRWGSLQYVQLSGRPLASELAQYLCITRPSATSLINALARSGYIRRSADKEDRRAVRLEVTAKGSAYLHQGKHRVERELAKMMNGLSVSEQKQFVQLLSKIIKYNERFV